MAIKMIFDPAYNVQSPTMVLTYKSGKSIGAILPQSLHFADSLNSHNEFSFDVYKSVDGVECKHWSKITDFKLVYCVEWDAYFEIYVEIDESNETIKHILGRALSEAELAQVKLYGLEVNTELDISRDDYEPTIIYNSEKEDISLLHKLLEKMPNFIIGHVDTSIAKLQRTFTFDDKTIYDAFQEVSEEVNCLFEFIAKKGENGQIERIINVYDIHSFCNECGCREIDSDICPNYDSNPTGHSDYHGTDIRHGFGEDTTVFISTRNLADNITYTSDADSVKNCFKLTAGDDLMTATVRNCSPSKSGYLWHFTEDIKADMSDELRDKLNGYESYSQYCRDEYPIFDNNMSYMWSSALTNYNSVVNKYNNYVDDSYSVLTGDEIGYSTLMKIYYDTIDLELLLRNKLMPKATLEDTSANEQLTLLLSEMSGITVAALNHESMSTVSAGNAVEGMARIFVDSRFRVEVTTKSYDNSSGSWYGNFTITRYSNDTDTVTSDNKYITIISDYAEYTKQKIEKKLYKETEEATNVVSLFDLEKYTNENDFVAELSRYCLNSLISFRDACQACLDMMIELGITNTSSHDSSSSSFIDGSKAIYDDIYIPYWDRRNWIDEEIEVRNTEINNVTGYYNVNGQLIKYGMMTYLDWVINAIQSGLDLEGYMREGGTTEDEAIKLISELASFRREDTYKNDNFVSDGLDNAELFSRALEFVDEAEKDIKAAAVPVHTISSTLKNLLVMKEFEPIVNYFKVGNWIRIEIDEQIYKLRLIKYEIDFNDLNNISVEFSDVQAVKDSTDDIQSILNQASTIASNYSNIKIIANQSKKTGEYVWEWVNEGLSLTKMKIIDSAENQNISWDENGFLCREYSPITDAYDDKQLKIINKGLYVTDDNWLTSKAGIGNFIYYDPSDSAYKEGYGVIADTLVGNLILSKEVGIYNENNSVQIDKDGFVITTKSGNDSVFTIQKEISDDTGNSSIESLLYVDDNGDLHIKGNITATSLSLSSNIDLSDNINLEGYLTNDDLDGYAKSEEINKVLEGYATNDKLNSYLLTSVYEDTDHMVFAVTRGKDEDGQTYFVVDKDGLLTARNAVIYGTIYASGGEFVGSLMSGSTKGGYNFIADDGAVKLGRLDTSGNYSMMVNADGSITFGSGVSLSWGNISSKPTILTESDVTTITNSCISAAEINANQITSGLIKSSNYPYSYYSSSSTAGSVLDLSNGYFNFGGGAIKYDSNGLSVNGSITATSLTIGSVDASTYISNQTDSIKSTAESAASTANTVNNTALKKNTVYSGTASSTAPTNYDSVTGSYFYVDSSGNLWAKNGHFAGDLYAGIITDSYYNFTATDDYVGIGYESGYGNILTVDDDGMKIGNWTVKNRKWYYQSNNYFNAFMYAPSSVKDSAFIATGYTIEEYLEGSQSGYNNIDDYTNFVVYHDGRISAAGKIKSKDSFEIENNGVTYFSATTSQVITTGALTVSSLGTFNGGLTIKDNNINVFSTISGGVAISNLGVTGYISCAGAFNIGAGNITINAATDGESSTLADKVATFKVDRDMYFTPGNGMYDHTSGENIIRMTTGSEIRISNSSVVTRLYGSVIYTSTEISPVSSSDSRLKTNIECFSEKHEEMFNVLRPVSFKYINGTSDRTHYGFIAQEVRDAALSVGMTTQDIAAFVSIPNDDLGEEYTLRYGEFISLNTHMIQKCLTEIDTLKAENESLKLQLENIKQSISN